MKKNKILIISAILLIFGILVGSYYSKDLFHNSSQKNDPTLNDDFYETINSEYLASIEIPEEEYQWGTLSEIGKKIENDENEIVKEILKNKDNNPNMYTYYQNLLNKEARDKLGFSPIKQYMDKIDSAQNMTELMNVLYELDNEIGTTTIFDISLDKDLKDKNKKMMTINSIESNCAIFNEPSYAAQLFVYKQMFKDFFFVFGYSKQEVEKMVEDYFNLENEACTGSLSILELRDIDKTYNIYTLDEIKDIFSNIDIDNYLQQYHLDQIDSFRLISENTAREYNKLFIDKNLNIIKVMAKINILYTFNGSLTTSLDKIAIDANNSLLGTVAKSDEDQALENVKGMFRDVVEEKFVLKYKDAMQHNIELTKQVINDIREEYYNNINNVKWMSDYTKNNALKKLDNLTVRVGYPEKFDIVSNNYQFKSYDEGSNLVENQINAFQVNRQHDIDKFFNKLEDDSTWNFYVDDLNAYYDPSDNSINILLGILFAIDEDADYYEVLGTIGFAVGHEITHAFDFSGSKFDENGNYINWWLEDDLKKFNSKKQEVIDYYKPFKYNNMNLNVELEAGENMADLGSMETILNMLSKKTVTNEEYKKLFESYAKFWASKYRDGYVMNFLLNDEHAPGKIRVNAVLSNLEKFYEIYDIKSGDGMYIEPSKRIHIWSE